MKKLISGIGQTAEINYKVSVLENGKTVRSFPKKRNLILDQGLNSVATTVWCDNFQVAVVGTGTTPVKRDSAAVTADRSGTTVTASAGFFEAADVGRLIKFDSGEEAYITAFTDSTHVTTNSSGTIAASEFTVWYVNLTALTAETKRSQTYSSDGGANGSTFSVATWTNKRTVIFSAEAGPITYREIGWSNTLSTGANLFGRDLLAGAGVSLVAGQQLKVEVELSITLSPASSTAWVNTITGWATDGVQGIEGASLSTVASNGSTSGNHQLEPSNTASSKLFVTVTATAIQPLASTPFALQATTGGTNQINVANDAYVAGSFTRTRSATYTVGQANIVGIRSVLIASDNGANVLSHFRVLLDSPGETKDSNHTLQIVFRYSWGRTLVN